MTIDRLRAALLSYYRAQHRDLPWRHTHDPYAIWVSEIMLQQTQVDTVLPRYAAFLARFPTVGALAAAAESSVCEAWAGLGYYRRARHLHAAAQRIVRDYAGELPRTAAELQRLPGIGRYTAGAVASIAFGESAPVVDGNVVRVLCRLHAIDAPPQAASTQKQLWALAQQLVQGEAPGDLNQALMDLGATLCTPQTPRCGVCPVQRFCAAAHAPDPTRYPTPTGPTKRQNLDIAFAWLPSRRGIWLRQRPLDGLWAGLWEPPSAEGRTGRHRLATELGCELLGPVARVTHELSHRHVRAAVYRAAGEVRLARSVGLRPFADPLGAPLSALANKAIRAAQERLDSRPSD